MKICANPDCDSNKDTIEWEDTVASCPLCGKKEFKYPNRASDTSDNLKMEDYLDLSVSEIDKIDTTGLLISEDTKKMIITPPVEKPKLERRIIVEPVPVPIIKEPPTPVNISVPATAHPITSEVVPQPTVKSIEITEEKSALDELKKHIEKGIEDIKTKTETVKKKEVKDVVQPVDANKPGKIYRRIEITLYIALVILVIILFVFLFKINIDVSAFLSNFSVNNSKDLTVVSIK